MNVLIKMYFDHDSPHQRVGSKTQISASWKVAEFEYEYSVTMNILKTIK